MNDVKTQTETKEPQYQCCIDLARRQGTTRFGLMTNYMWHNDPRHLAFLLSRYKFVAKMLSGRGHVLEVGCADAFGTRVVLQEVKRLTAVDFDPVFVQDVQGRMDERWKFECLVHDMIEKPLPGPFDAAYAMDVIEHIPLDQEERFVGNIAKSLMDHGVLILGSPSLQSQAYASEASKQGHVNCKDQRGLKELLGHFFHNIFVFSMNDEVVHTGYSPMAQYLIGLACDKK
jgi:cyclopropane fatty-acyl-phospholipid synthase-like methyltransferase